MKKRPLFPRPLARHVTTGLALPLTWAGLSLAVAESLPQKVLTPDDAYQPRNTQPPGPVPPSPAEAAALIATPPELKATLFAGEPDVRQPIDIKVDDRGRVWVCEAYSYKEWERRGEDRIVILTDHDGDGVADERKIFRSGFNHLSSVEFGFGGVWVLDAPHLWFIPDADGDGTPDGEAVAVLDGWTTEAIHNVPSGLTWGPDGWLYGRHGIVSTSLVGVPGTPEDQRVRLDVGIWRFHPLTKKVEQVFTGMTNPWGLDWDEHGEMFVSGNVNGHLWHGIPGALCERMYGAGLVPHDYERLTMIGERPHYAGTGNWKADWNVADKGRDAANDLGGGHSHVGLLIYQSDTWPARFRHHFFMNNTHGRRVNEDIAEPRGASYVSRHLGDPIRVGTSWFRGVSLTLAPDGNVYVSDWCDDGECHDDDGVHRTSGRVYKISAREDTTARSYREALARRPLREASDQELVKWLASPNDWFHRRARRVLQERAAAGRPLASEALTALRALLESAEQPTLRLRAAWTLHALGQLTEKDRLRLTKSPVIALRWWGVRLIAEPGTPSEAEAARLREMAAAEPHPRVRLELASSLPRLASDLAWALGRELVRRDAAAQLDAPAPVVDPTLELVLWHVFQPLVVPHAEEASRLAFQTPFPKLSRFIGRRLASELDEPTMRALLGVRLRESADALAHTTATPALPFLQGVADAVQGRAGRPAPEGWSDTAKRLLALAPQAVREATLTISVACQDEATLALLREEVRHAATPELRAHALSALSQARVPDLPELLTTALADPTLRLTALRALTAVDDERPARAALVRWRELSPAEKTAAVEALATRPATGRLLLEALAAGQVARTDISVTQARQLAALRDPELTRLLETHWGQLSAPNENKEALIAEFKARLSRPAATPPNLTHGRELFASLCGACHTLFGEGGKLGPDLTGGGRKDLDYLLRNVLDPSAVVPADYRMIIVTLHDGQVLAGVVPAQDERTVTVQTIAERRVLERAQIAKIEQQPYSWMPEGLFESLPEGDLRDLIAYLQSDGPPPTP